MIIHYIYKSAAIQAIGRPENLFCKFGDFMVIGKRINGPVKNYPFLNPFRVVEFLFSLYEIADEISY